MHESSSSAVADVPTVGRAGWLRSPWLWAFLAGVVVLTLMRPLLRHEPDPLPVLGSVPSFELIDQRARPVGSEDLRGGPWLATFFFTRCGSICPRQMTGFAALGARLDRDGLATVPLVGLTVDPGHDDPATLADYGDKIGVRDARWTLLTGPREEILRVAEGFLLHVGEPAAGEGGVDVAHSGKLVLVDAAGNVRGYYDTDDPEGLDEAFHRTRQLAREATP